MKIDLAALIRSRMSASRSETDKQQQLRLAKATKAKKYKKKPSGKTK